MTAERAEAYGRIMSALSTCFVRTSSDEVERLRQVCDALVFARTTSREDRHAITDAIVVLADLAERGDISSQQASAMVQDIARCAPATPTDTEATIS